MRLSERDLFTHGTSAHPGKSESLRALLHPSTQHLPKATTILENVNLIDKVASKKILKEQLRWLCCEDKTKEWEQITVDSSALHANASYPQDSVLIVENLDALVRDFVRIQEALGLENTLSVKVDRWVTQVHQDHKHISLGCRKRRAKQIRRKLYRSLILSTIKVMKCLQLYELKNMESRIYNKHQARKLRRHNLHNVGCELFNKVFAYNLCRYLRRKQKHPTAQPQAA